MFEERTFGEYKIIYNFSYNRSAFLGKKKEKKNFPKTADKWREQDKGNEPFCWKETSQLRGGRGRVALSPGARTTSCRGAKGEVEQVQHHVITPTVCT